MRDLVSNIGDALAIAPAVHTASANGIAIALLGAGSLAFIISTGAIVGAGDFTAKVQESDTSTSGDFTDAPSAKVLGTIPTTLAATDTVKVGYIGNKPFARLALVRTGGTSIALSAVAVTSNLQHRPAA